MTEQEAFEYLLSEALQEFSETVEKLDGETKGSDKDDQERTVKDSKAYII